jgi:hypothetical protein
VRSLCNTPRFFSLRRFVVASKRTLPPHLRLPESEDASPWYGILLAELGGKCQSIAMFRNVQADQLPPEAQLDLKQQPATDEDVQGRPRHGVYEDLADQVRGHDEPRRMWSRLRDETANRDAATGRNHTYRSVDRQRLCVP